MKLSMNGASRSINDDAPNSRPSGSRPQEPHNQAQADQGYDQYQGFVWYKEHQPLHPFHLRSRQDPKLFASLLFCFVGLRRALRSAELCATPGANN